MLLSSAFCLFVSSDILPFPVLVFRLLTLSIIFGIITVAEKVI